jgi:hypothetical protein
MRREEAEEVYRNAWLQYCLAISEDRKMFLEGVMDYAQPFIAKGSCDPHWKEFTDTLPGFKEFWDNWKAKMDIFCLAIEKIEKRKV